MVPTHDETGNLVVFFFFAGVFVWFLILVLYLGDISIIIPNCNSHLPGADKSSPNPRMKIARLHTIQTQSKCLVSSLDSNCLSMFLLAN